MNPSTPSQVSRAQVSREFPEHWWKPVPTEGSPEWEILPQAAGPGEVILSKRHELGLLSNFAATPFEFRGKRYASLEGFWQMMLYPEDSPIKHPGIRWKFTREQVAAMVGLEAKEAGRLAEANMKALGISWVSFEGERFEYRPKTPGKHYQLIVEATRAKVLQNRNVREALLSTGDLILRPDHRQSPDDPAAWRYYLILMEIREALQGKAQLRSES